MSLEARRPRRRIAGCALLVAGAALVLSLSQSIGCGWRSTQVPLAPISGTVSYRGKPLPHGQIVMVHSSGQMAAGKIHADGGYAMEAPVGDNRVMIICQEQPPGIPQNPLNPSKSRIPARYVSYATSGLKISVVDGDNTHDWNLTD